MEQVEVHLKNLAEKQADMQSRVRDAELELAKKTKEVEKETLNKIENDRELLLAQQNLRTANEKHAEQYNYYKKNLMEIKELTIKLANTNRKIDVTSKKLNGVRMLQETYKKLKVEYQEKVKADEYNSDGEEDDNSDDEYQMMKAQVDRLLEKQEKLDKGDLLARLISTGQAVNTVVVQTQAVVTSLEDKRQSVELLRTDLAEKQNAVKKLQLAIRMDVVSGGQNSSS